MGAMTQQATQLSTFGTIKPTLSNKHSLEKTYKRQEIQPVKMMVKLAGINEDGLPTVQ